MIGFRIQGSVAILEMTHERGAFVSRSFCESLSAALDQALEDNDTSIILLLDQNHVFAQGTDLSALDKDASQQALRRVLDQIETSAKPIVLALTGNARGAGAELALAAHFRIAAPGVKLGFPDIRYGLPPGGGATQRLPRLIGADAALKVLLEGPLVAASRLGPVFDAEISGDFASGALQFAQGLADEHVPPFPVSARREGFSDPFAYQAAIEAHKDKAKAHGQAGVDILRCVESALLLPFGAGLDLEHECFKACAGRPRPKALRHLALAERDIARRTQSLAQQSSPLGHVAILGAGAEARYLIARCLLRGLDVTAVHLGAIDKPLFSKDIFGEAAQSAPGKSTAEIAELAEQLEIAEPVSACAGADMVIEAAELPPSETLRLFEELGHVVPGHTILASTSLDVGLEDCAHATGRAAQVIGLQPLRAVPGRDIAVLCHSAETGGFATATGARFAHQIGLLAVPVVAATLGVLDRPRVALWQAADQLLRDGASCAGVDAAMRSFGWSEGPFQQLDVLGCDAALLQARRVMGAEDRHLPTLSALQDAGQSGRMSGQGFYSYDAETGRQVPSTTATKLIHGLRGARGARMSSDDIQMRLVAALANVGAGLIAEGTVEKPADFDVIAIYGLGFPAALGGPLQVADELGLLRIRNALTGASPLLEPQEFLLDMIKNGRRFAHLNQDGAA